MKVMFLCAVARPRFNTLSEFLVGQKVGNLAHWGLGASAEEVKELT